MRAYLIAVIMQQLFPFVLSVTCSLMSKPHQNALRLAKYIETDDCNSETNPKEYC